MLESLIASSLILITQRPDASPQFMQLKSQLESYGFEVNLAIPPSFNPPEQQPGIRRTVRKPYGLLNSQDKSIWINPIVFDSWYCRIYSDSRVCSCRSILFWTRRYSGDRTRFAAHPPGTSFF